MEDGVTGGSSKAVRIVLADDHLLVRAGIRSVMQSLPNVEIVAEATNGVEVLDLVGKHRPDVVMMDISMPGLSGLDATARLKGSDRNLHVLILSVHATEEYVIQALRSGADGYLLKDADATELDTAIGAVLQGGTYLSPSISKHVTDYVQRVGGEAQVIESLTDRQRETLELIAGGFSTREIAAELGISPKTVETHKARLMERLGIYDISSLTRYAVRAGLVSLD
jgi:DNA-binding NarL/FixJ family response regulator